jgi:hypothetical protein
MVDESGMIITQMGSTVDQEMVAVHGTFCTIPPPNSNQQQVLCICSRQTSCELHRTGIGRHGQGKIRSGLVWRPPFQIHWCCGWLRTGRPYVLCRSIFSVIIVDAQHFLLCTAFRSLTTMKDVW